MFSFVLVGVVVLMSKTVSADGGYSYVCNDDDSIVVSDLPSTSISFFAYQGSSVCGTSGDYNSLTITGCSKDSAIVLAHGTYVDMSSNQVLGGTLIETLNIECTEISTDGVDHYIDNTMAPSVSHAAELTISPTYDVTSSLNVSSAYVGDPILWSINYPSSYYLEITNCKAYPGTTSGSTYVNLIDDWCTDTTQLLTNFASTTNSGVATSVIEAFKFYNNNVVYLYCDLVVCPSSSGCTTSCGGKKRSVADEQTGPDAPHRAGVGTFLHITDPYSSANVNVPGLLLLTAAMIATFAH